LPLGDFDANQKKILMLTAEYMKLYFGMPVKIHKAVPLSAIPSNARRTHPTWGDKQILSTYVLHDLLKKRRPADAVAFIALTTSDLWPGKGWNFVYGQASLRERVGVWSMYRNGDPSGDADEFALCLRRTLKTATHETGHILTIKHCIAYACNMNGSNHRQESDRQPLALCPVCLQKLCWNANIDPAPRFDRLAEFFKKNNLPDAQKAAAAAAQAVELR
jgi:archaemetzincin